MSTVACKDCGQQVSRTAKSCPNCGRPQHQRRGCLVQAIALVVAVGLMIWWLTAGMVQTSKVGMTQIKNQVAEDAAAQYKIAAAQGDRMQRCVQAGFAAAAYLQAQDSDSYDQWKAVQKHDCRAAGMPQ